jgi:hypothetical protein
MRVLADLACADCGAEYYGDLPSGHGLYYPTLLDRVTGRAIADHPAPWFASWLEDSYGERVEEAPPLEVETARTPRRAILLNCLDVLYGHALLKLLNAQHYLDHRPDRELIVLVPRFLRWLVPDGVAAIWTVDLPLRRGTEWNDGLARAIAQLVAETESCELAAGLAHPHPDDFDITRFSRTERFPLDRWAELTPAVTYAWRSDRVWASGSGHRLVGAGAGAGFRRRAALRRHVARVVSLAEAIRAVVPGLRFAVAGVAEPGALPEWIDDVRVTRPDEGQERKWCRLYAGSHVVVGVHGSNMLLPSAHAGGVVELMPDDRWGNLGQDILLRPGDLRETLYRTRVVPVGTPPDGVAAAVTALLLDHEGMRIAYGHEWTRFDPALLASLAAARAQAAGRG